MPSGAPIVCGIAGWSYPDWDGYVYPRGTRDKLRYVAAFFDVLEINSTFYRPPDARTAREWLRRTADWPALTFTAKLHQDITHRGVIDAAVVTAFHDAFAPFVAAGKLRHLLAQFRYDFDDTPAHRRHLEFTHAAFGDLANLTLELRHRSWQQPEGLLFLRDLGVGVANLDYPLAANSFDLAVTGIGAHAYLRLHGRNAEAWFSKEAGRDDTYNYLYNDRELGEIAARARRIAGAAKTVTLIANNHFRGKEAANALQLKAMLSGGRVDVPPSLIAHYPGLRAVARPTGELPL